MPATTPNPAKAALAKPDRDREAPRFVRCDLNAAQKLDLVKWDDEQERTDLAEWLDKVISRGHVLSVRANDVGYQASLTGMTQSSGHEKQCLIARASTANRAVMALWFKDVVILTEGWPIKGTEEDFDY